MSFFTKGFLIRYCEEEVEINDVVLFRDELTVDKDLYNTDIYVEFDLFFSDLQKMGGPSTCMKNIGQKDFEKIADFKSVQK